MLPVILGGIGLSALGAYLFMTGKSAGPVGSNKMLPVGVPVKVPGNFGPVTIVALPPTAGAGMVPGGQVLQTGVTPAGNPVLGTVSTQTGSPSSIAANNLHDYLKANGVDNSTQMKGLVTAFQNAGMNDVKNVAYGDSMTPNGVYDLATSAALSVFLGDPITPDTQGQPFAVMPFAFISDPNKPGLSVMSGNNLYFYLRLHGNDKTPACITFVKQFQHDVNTDLKYPKGHVTGKLKEDGGYGTDTAAALSVYGFAVKP